MKVEDDLDVPVDDVVDVLRTILTYLWTMLLCRLWTILTYLWTMLL